ncbi:MAG: ParB/RepB/Spo0J family partition protein [Pikeienuella sp.]|uniref:ParB/RepB/Spo0J family partition protein n=1 Tax=Pikeienuella sp. TaxID=2831957 RepID=UPI00391D81CF
MNAPELWPLEALALSKLNPRATPPSAERVAALAGSIRSVGLLQPLIGVRVEREDGDRAEIVAGGVRLRALKSLAASGDWPEDRRVPVILVSGDAARIAGLAEQASRLPLDPVDEFQAYHQTKLDGASEAEIAAAFAVSERYVKQRLALAALPAEPLAALRAREITLDVAMALASAGARAASMWKKYERDARHHPDYARRQIRAELAILEDGHHQLRRLEQIGREAFEAAGGRIEEDLFGGVRLVNPEALAKAEEATRVDRAAALAKEAGWLEWAWLEDAGEHWVRIKPALPGLSAEEAAEFAALQAREGWPDELGEEDDKRADELAERAEADRWSNDQLFVGTALIDWPPYCSEPRIVGAAIEPEGIETARARGLLPPAGDQATEDQRAALGLPETLDLSAAREAATPPRASEPEPGADWPAALVADLRNLAGDIAREQLLDKPDLALSLLAWSLAIERVWNRPLAVDHQPTTRSGLIALDAAVDGWKATGDETFAAFLAKGAKHRNRLLACVAASTFKGAKAQDFAVWLDLDLRAHWTPDAPFFKRLTRDQLVAVAEEIGAKGDRVKATMKKAELVEALAAVFADPPEEIAETVRAWLPAPIRAKDVAI